MVLEGGACYYCYHFIFSFFLSSSWTRYLLGRHQILQSGYYLTNYHYKVYFHNTTRSTSAAG